MNYLLFMFLIVLIALILMFVLPMAKSEEIELGGTGIELPDIPISAIFSRQSIENPKNQPYYIDLRNGNSYSADVNQNDKNLWVNNIVLSNEYKQWGLSITDKLRDVAKKLPLKNLFQVINWDKAELRTGYTNLETGETFYFPTKNNRQLTKIV